MNDKPENIIDAEVANTERGLVARPQSKVATISDLEQAFAMAVRQRELLAEYIKKQLQPGKHFYAREGQKPSLTKEGAEIILLPHGFVPDYETQSGPAEPPEDNKPYQITVKCTLRHKGDPNSFVGSGIGSAGSHHGYWDKKESRWSYKPRQPDKYLCHNATLKMAQKSAMIAATINSTAASEFFTQDMGPETPQDAPEPEKVKSPTPPPPTPPTPKSAPNPAQCKVRLIENLTKEDLVQKALQFLIDLAWLLPTEKLDDLHVKYAPVTKEEYVTFLSKLTLFAATGKAEKPYEPHYTEESKPTAAAPSKPIEVPRDPDIDPASPTARWRSFPLPYGEKAGTPLAELDKDYLYGWCMNFKVEETWKGDDGKIRKTNPEKLDKQREFRHMLDEAIKHYNFVEKGRK